MMNLGMQYKLDKHATIRLDAYNVLGWFDDTLNKNMMLGSRCGMEPIACNPQPSGFRLNTASDQYRL